MKLITPWSVKTQNRPYTVLRGNRILKLKGHKHNRSVLRNLIDTMSSMPFHLFMYEASFWEDLDVHAPNVLPILHIETPEDYRTKLKWYLALGLSVPIISISCNEAICVDRKVDTVMLSGNSKQNMLRTIGFSRKAGAAVYVESFDGFSSLPEILRYRELSTAIQDKLILCSLWDNREW